MTVAFGRTEREGVVLHAEGTVGDRRETPGEGEASHEVFIVLHVSAIIASVVCQIIFHGGL